MVPGKLQGGVLLGEQVHQQPVVPAAVGAALVAPHHGDSMHAEALGYARAMAGWFFVVAGALGLALGIFVDGWTSLAVAAMFIGLAGESLARGTASGRNRLTDT
jgi:hypothetical protein